MQIGELYACNVDTEIDGDNNWQIVVKWKNLTLDGHNFWRIDIYRSWSVDIKWWLGVFWAIELYWDLKVNLWELSIERSWSSYSIADMLFNLLKSWKDANWENVLYIRNWGTTYIIDFSKWLEGILDQFRYFWFAHELSVDGKSIDLSFLWLLFKITKQDWGRIYIAIR